MEADTGSHDCCEAMIGHVQAEIMDKSLCRRPALQ